MVDSLIITHVNIYRTFASLYVCVRINAQLPKRLLRFLPNHRYPYSPSWYYDRYGYYGSPAYVLIDVLSPFFSLSLLQNRQTFRRIVLKSAHKKRVEYEKLLEGVPMLSSLNAYERMNLCDALMPKGFSDGDCIIRQGDNADGELRARFHFAVSSGFLLLFLCQISCGRRQCCPLCLTLTLTSAR